MSKPQDHFGYEPQQTEACERLLVTLLRSIGPWKSTVTLIGGLVPSLLFASDGHVGTTDIDLVLDLETIATTQAYRTIEQNLKKLGLKRGRNEDGDVQHFRWTREKEGEEPVTVEFLCPASEGRAGKIVALKESGQKRLSAVGISAAHLVFEDYIEKTIVAELLDSRGKASVTLRLAGIVSYIVLKALAYEDRMEPKDAYDLLFVLLNYEGGPEEVGKLFAAKMTADPSEPLYQKTLDILRSRFLNDAQLDGAEKDGPTSYGLFIAPDEPEDQALARQNAVSAVSLFMEAASPSL